MRIWKLEVLSGGLKVKQSLHLFKFMARRAERREWEKRQAVGIYLVERYKFPDNIGTGGRIDGISFTTYVDREDLGL